MHQDRTRRGKSNDAKCTPAEQGAGILSFFRSRAVRESAESIVIAFALAFLIRTFEAEAFVIPTGSMAPTLMGRHRDVECPQCTFKYRVGASQEVDRFTEARIGSVFAATCPMCGYTACINPQYGPQAKANVYNSGPGATCQGADNAWRNGNRILVSKFAYDRREPTRWDIFVFRPPHDAAKNYIKRLVGMPNETLRVHRGDLYVGPYNPAALRNPDVLKSQYNIERKPPDKVLAMKQLVYDNDYLQPSLTQKGWPTRWSSWPRLGASPPAAGDWQSGDGTKSFSTDGTAAANGKPAEVWIRYQHFFPSFDNWEEMLGSETLTPLFRSQIRPQLITDTYAYNSSVALMYNSDPLEWGDPFFLGLNWVRDLVLECEMIVDKPQGAALLELVAGGVSFRCRIDLSTGEATLSMAANGAKYAFTDATGNTQPSISQKTPMHTAGSYRLRLANVDHQLHLWVNEQLVQFPMPATYGELDNFIPKTDMDDGLDLAPAGVGSEGAALRVNHLRLYRDVYYIAKVNQNGPAMDFLDGKGPDLAPKNDEEYTDVLARRATFFSSPSVWPAAFATLKQAAFPLAKGARPSEDQFFAMGDNSPQSLDSRLWKWSPSMKLNDDGEPDRPNREYYVERDLLIGKALLIYWPVSQWGFVR